MTQLPNDSITQYKKRGSEGKVRVHGSHEIVSHDADAARQPFQAIGGIGLEDIRGAEEEEPDECAAEASHRREKVKSLCRRREQDARICTYRQFEIFNFQFEITSSGKSARLLSKRIAN